MEHKFILVSSSFHNSIEIPMITKNYLHTIIVFLFCMQMAAIPLRAQVNPKKPNVIIVLTDDQGYGDFSCHGNPVLKTPALDKLYQESIRFTDFHVAPLCTPTRGQLMTGMDALHNKAMAVGNGRQLMRRDMATMPEVFLHNGYETGLFGKWHLGDNFPDRPIDRGFRKAVWTKGWGLLSESEYDNDYYRTRFIDSIEQKQSEKYCTDLWFDEAMRWMQQMHADKKPFFTYIATNTPHGPFYAPAMDKKYFMEKGLDEKTAHFLGMVRNIDSNMARLDRWLQQSSLHENTIVIFMTDNGGTGGVNVYNAGMREQKGSLYEGGHRAACFIRLPAKGAYKGRTVNTPTQVQDVLPTLADLAALHLEHRTQLDGKSLHALIQGKKSSVDNRMFVVQYSKDDQPEKFSGCVIWKEWRLVGQDELYNINIDPGQIQNVAGSNKEIVQQMKNFYESWWDKGYVEMRKFIPAIVGAHSENPVILTSDYWINGEHTIVNTQWKVALAQGSPNGGLLHVWVEEEGNYVVELSRWPFHLGRSLTEDGPAKAIGGTSIRKGVALPIDAGCLSINDEAPVVIKKSGNSSNSISINCTLKAGAQTLRAWFQNAEGRDLCGAYYLRVTRL